MSILAKVDPYQNPIPPVSPELEQYLRELDRFLKDLWERTGGGRDLIETNEAISSRPDFTTRSLGDIEGVYLRDGVPSNDLGANGEFYFRRDGTTDVIYHKQSGSWVAVA